MNIFCCSKPLWIGESWLCTVDNTGKIESIEAEISNTLPIYLGQLGTGTLNVLKQMIEELGGKMFTDDQALMQQETCGEGILVADPHCYVQLLQTIKRNKWRIREAADMLEGVLTNLLKALRVKQEILLEQPNNLAHFAFEGDIVETMSHYPFVQNGTPIGVYLDSFAQVEDVEVNILALQSKGYQVVLYVLNDDEYRRVKQLKTDFIMYQSL